MNLESFYRFLTRSIRSSKHVTVGRIPAQRSDLQLFVVHFNKLPQWKQCPLIVLKLICWIFIETKIWKELEICNDPIQNKVKMQNSNLEQFQSKSFDWPFFQVFCQKSSFFCQRHLQHHQLQVFQSIFSCITTENLDWTLNSYLIFEELIN